MISMIEAIRELISAGELFTAWKSASVAHLNRFRFKIKS